jgi:predicted Zn-dependent protease
MKEPAKDASAPAKPVSQKQPDRSDAYYHFQLGHMYEEMVAVTGRTEYASKAVAEYKAALQADPDSPYLASALAELYARTGDIRDAVAEAQDVISRDPICAPSAICRAARRKTPKPFSTLPLSSTGKLCVWTRRVSRTIFC